MKIEESEAELPLREVGRFVISAHWYLNVPVLDLAVPM
jgi:hypothetical protein